MALLQQAENTYEELLSKREGVEDERNKLLKTIERLDVQKKEEVTKAYKEVNSSWDSFTTISSRIFNRINKADFQLWI